MMMTDEEELAHLSSINQEEEDPNPIPHMEEVEMSPNTIIGEDGITTMRLLGEYDKQKLHILLDSGSCLSFCRKTWQKNWVVL